MVMKLIVLEGTDGSGKSHHTDALAARLHAAGIAAESYHHPPAPTRDPYRAALHYATARAEFCQWAPSRLVYVVDRWIESTVAVGWTLDAKTHKAERNALWRLATAERAILPAASLVVVLDTTDDELDRRLLTRGHSVTDVDRACRAVYRDPSVLGPWGAVRVDTSGDVAAVETRLLAMALARLGRIDDAADLWHEAREAPDFHEWVGLTRVAYAEALGTRWAGEGFDANGSEVTT
jgi:thymidylate kinase